MSGTTPRILVIGIGNEYRGDDAIGLEIARRIRALGPGDVAVVEHSGDMAALLDSWQSANTVLLVDAVQSGSAPGTVFRFDALAADLPSVFVPHVSSHGVGVADAVALARALGRLPEKLIVYGIEGRVFDARSALSPEVAAVMDEAVQRIVQELGWQG
jgi:hydrogenase maturation protease